MVTIKRKIGNKEEKYGNFTTIDVESEISEAESGKSFWDSQISLSENRKDAAIEYTTSNIVRKGDEQRIKEAQMRKPSVGEFMPQIRKEKREVSEPVSEKQKMDTKTKVLLGVYLSIVLLLSALVIGTGIALTARNSRISELENEIQAMNAQLLAQMSEIDLLSDDNAIAGRAYENGMEKVTKTEIVELIPMIEAQTHEGTTNWFDSFCDWVNGVLGG